MDHRINSVSKNGQTPRIQAHAKVPALRPQTGEKIERAVIEGFHQSIEYDRGLACFTSWFTDRKIPLLLYGGAARDFACLGPNARPRDYDFVLEKTDLSALLATFSSHLVGSNRFGGMRLNIYGTQIDCWELHNTWAFSKGKLALRSWEDLVDASILDIDGIVLRIHTDFLVRSTPFERAIRLRTIGLNFPDTFDWTAALFRSLSMAYRYKFLLDNDLLDVFLGDHIFSPELFYSMSGRRFNGSALMGFLNFLRRLTPECASKFADAITPLIRSVRLRIAIRNANEISMSGGQLCFGDNFYSSSDVVGPQG